MAEVVSPSELRRVIHRLSGSERHDDPGTAVSRSAGSTAASRTAASRTATLTSELINWVAGRQLGLVTYLQLLVIGLSRGAISGHLRRGRLHQVYRGVYAVGHAILVPGARELAAALACGPDVVVSHRSAAALWRLIDAPPEMVEVTAVRRRSRSRNHLWVHRVDQLAAADRTVSRGIPLTSPARTLIDLAAHAGEADLERAVAEARVLGLLRDGELDAAIGRAGRRRGAARMGAVLRAEGEPGHTRSEAERRMLRLIAEARLPRPRVNVRLHGYSVDFAWPEQMLVVEVDGYRFHGHRGAFERDRRRDMALVAAGYRVIRVTWRQLCQEPLAVAAALAGALAAAV